MLKIILSSFLVLGFSFVAFATEAPQLKEKSTSFFSDVYDQNVHSEIVNQLDLSRWGRKLFHKPLRSQNVNIYDEVADSLFFTNRHAKDKLSSAELIKGASINQGPDLSGDLNLHRVVNSDSTAKLFVSDSRGDQYVFEFDSAENMELGSAAEVIASRFYYALGYNVPQYTIAEFDQEKLILQNNSTIRNKKGFLNLLSQEKLEEVLMFVPLTMDIQLRVSAMKKLEGEDKGAFSFTGRRKADPEGIVNHRDRREIRSLIIFGAWLNHNDLRESNTRDMLVEENGKWIVKHYLMNFNGALGSAGGGVKPPHSGYEHLFDYGETAKAFLTLGFWEKPWQKKWRELDEKVHDSYAVGYFNNHDFDPASFKNLLPYEAFKRVTRADGFWAAKQILAFSDEDIRAIVSTGKFSSKTEVDYIAKTLIERRDLIARHWFSQSAPLDSFYVSQNRLIFKDLAVDFQFEEINHRQYRAYLVSAKGKKQKELFVEENAVVFDSSIFDENNEAWVEIYVNENSSSVRVKISSDSVLSIKHQD